MNTEATTFLGLLFEPHEVIEFRTKDTGRGYVSSSWFTASESHRIGVALGVWGDTRCHVWVGVCPRPKVGSSHPDQGRVLWCDLSAGATFEEAIRSAVEAGIPEPTLVVNSGNGWHLYWVLDGLYPVADLSPALRFLHGKLPTDNTHDTTRVMRLPGTVNYKNPDDPKPCYVHRNTGEVFPLAVFPKLADEPRVLDYQPKKPLSDEDRSSLVRNWYEGQRHDLSLALAGYLRKDRGYSRQESLNTILGIAHEAGQTDSDRELERAVETTYAKPLAHVIGSSGLYKLGLKVPDTPDVFSITRPKAFVPLIDLEDTSDVEPVEWWVPGLIGKGITCLWAGGPKVGKSFAVMQLAYAIATGRNIWDFHVVEPKSVLYFQGELSSSMVVDRAKRIFPAPLPIEKLCFTGKPSGVVDLIETPEVLLDLADRYEVVVIDPISLFHSGDENSSKGAMSVIALFDTLIHDGKCVVMVHHTRKTDGKTRLDNNIIRGSNAWFSRPDSIVLQTKHGDSGAVSLKFTYRAYEERDDLILFPVGGGAFGDSKERYLRDHPTVSLPVSRSSGELN